MGMDKDWRPNNWAQIKGQIVKETPITFSPSRGYSTDQKSDIMEKTASAILEAYINGEAGTQHSNS